MKYTVIKIIICLSLLCCQHANRSMNKNFSDLPWAQRMANAVIERNTNLLYYNNQKSISWQYDVSMLGQAINKLGDSDTMYSRYFENYLDYFIKENGEIKYYNVEKYNIDYVNPAKGLITLYKRTGKQKYLLAINQIIKQLENQPRTKTGGFWHKKIYPWQMWLDGIYMSSPFMAQYAKEFNQPNWFDTVAHQITLIYSKTLDTKTNLLYHAWDESKSQKWCNPETGQSLHFWGRAMGWYMMALVDVLNYFPKDHQCKDSIITIFKNTAEALLKVRDKKSGLWYQVLDKGGKEGNYLEASCSCMFTYAFAKGANNGYLSSRFLEIANKNFDAIVTNFIKEGKDGKPVLINICGGAGLGGNPYRDGSYEYYISEKCVDNDPKGVASFILAAVELKKIICND